MLAALYHPKNWNAKKPPGTLAYCASWYFVKMSSMRIGESGVILMWFQWQKFIVIHNISKFCCEVLGIWNNQVNTVIPQQIYQVIFPLHLVKNIRNFIIMNTPISCITTTDTDDVEGSNSFSLRNVAKCSTLPYENIPPSGLLGDGNSINTHVSRDAEASCHLVVPFILNKHIHPFGTINPQSHCYMNSVIQLLFSILRTISQNFQFNSSTEGFIPKYLFEIACSALSYTDVDALKFRLVQYDKFYSGEQQQDALECLTMLIELINKGSVPYCDFNDNNSTGFL